MGLARIYRLALVLSLAACGGGSPDAAGGDDDLAATSGGDDTTADGTGDELDPCAEGGAPCEGNARAMGAEGDAGVEGAEGDAGAEGDEAVATAEGEGGDAGLPVDPEQAWRDKVRLGRRWFMRRCDNCHPGGEEDIGPTLRRIRWSVPRMQRQIRRGSGRMRPIPPGRLSEENMDALMAYMSQFGGVRGVQRPE